MKLAVGKKRVGATAGKCTVILGQIGSAFRSQGTRSVKLRLACASNFPVGCKAQTDFIPEDTAAFRAAENKNKWKLSAQKTVFLVRRDDRLGAICDVIGKLARRSRDQCHCARCGDRWRRTLRRDVLGQAPGRYENGQYSWGDVRQYRAAAAPELVSE